MELEAVFPYESFRPGQRELAEAVYNSCRRGGRLVVEAMSGFGKTAPVLTGSILAAQEDAAPIVYACRTKRQVFRVIEEVSKIQRRIPIQAAHLFSKSDYCLLKETSKFPVSQEAFKWYCSFNTTNNLCSYFLNFGLLNREVASLARRFAASAMTHPTLISESRRAHVCPYEVARLAIAGSKVIVTTYHYLLDEASSSVLFANIETKPSDVHVILDEAHNIRDFVRDANTTALTCEELERAVRDSSALHLERLASSLRGILEEMRKASAQQSWYVDKTKLADAIRRDYDVSWMPNLAFELSAVAGIGWESAATGKNIPSSILRVGDFIGDFLSSLTLPQKTMAKSDHGFFLVDTDPSRRFAEIARGFRSLTLLSATIDPSDLFLRSIGLKQTATIHKVDVNHTFNIKTIIDTSVTTRYKYRDSDMYTRITSKVLAMGEVMRGGIGVFAPSYLVLESLDRLIRQEIRDRELLTETRGMSNAEADGMMQTFKTRPGSILLAVQGGRFSEGEDFPGDQMDASVVVGLAIPPPSPTMYAEYAKTELSKHESYLVISLLPALRKAIQSAGRHVRNLEKKGMVFFLDSRFNDAEIMSIMPSWLKHEVNAGDFTAEEIKRLTAEFWSKSASSQ